jgi:hypothetical protein
LHLLAAISQQIERAQLSLFNRILSRPVSDVNSITIVEAFVLAKRINSLQAISAA